MDIGIIDYGSGNIRSVAKSFERAVIELGVGAKINIIKNAEELRKMDRIVLPGVGSFGDCMHSLKSIEDLFETLNEVILKKSKPFLGICLGMQLLADLSHEYGKHKGLGWIGGKVIPIDRSLPSVKIPHMGWNSVKIIKQHAIFNNIKDEEDFYFVHSYKFISETKENICAETFYHQDISAVLIKNNIIGTQFHPEKSQNLGIQFIKNFIEWAP
tara:strand:- start:138 stop:779 length:642 start_codon:yes stop_codon:yes gene_type:complete